ncbi:pyrroline-5-carboxylate reductase [Spirochaetia bacterium]|nr:pyrroline-5-carboxylate reductase [Spirochaetia bacterium]
MSSITIACIGSGNMGGALMRGAAASIGGGNIGFSDADKAKAKAVAKSLKALVYASNTEAVQKADYIFLAVKPQVLGSVLEEIAPAIQRRITAGSAAKAASTKAASVKQAAGGKGPVLVSMAAGWSIAKVQAMAGAHTPVIRIMPNTPALIGQGMIALAASAEVPANKIAELEKILKAAGEVDRLEEKYLDAVTGLSGSGPAFVYLFIEALADGGVRAGLPRDKALRYAAQTVLGSAAMVKETGKHPGELKDMVTSPAGTTIAGVAALEKGAFRGTVMAAVEAAWRRAAELG